VRSVSRGRSMLAPLPPRFSFTQPTRPLRIREIFISFLPRSLSFLCDLHSSPFSLSLSLSCFVFPAKSRETGNFSCCASLEEFSDVTHWRTCVPLPLPASCDPLANAHTREWRLREGSVLDLVLLRMGTYGLSTDSPIDWTVIVLTSPYLPSPEN